VTVRYEVADIAFVPGTRDDGVTLPDPRQKASLELMTTI
jgi:hypothetical protein